MLVVLLIGVCNGLSSQAQSVSEVTLSFISINDLGHRIRRRCSILEFSFSYFSSHE